MKPAYNPDVDEIIAKALCLDSNAAEALYLSSIEDHPDVPELYFNLGTLYVNRDEPEKAIKPLMNALALAPESPLVHYYLGRACDECHELAVAEQYYLNAIRIEPNYSDPYYALSLLLRQRGKAALAIPYCRKYIELEPCDKRAKCAQRIINEATKASKLMVTVVNLSRVRRLPAEREQIKASLSVVLGSKKVS